MNLNDIPYSTASHRLVTAGALFVHRPHPVHHYAPHTAPGGTPGAVIIILVIAVAAAGLLRRRRR